MSAGLIRFQGRRAGFRQCVADEHVAPVVNGQRPDALRSEHPADRNRLRMAWR
jgi:hypothetical protein